MGEVKLTKAQVWALKAIADGHGTSPAMLGQRMMDRPGAMGERSAPYKAQGYGRMGGAMMKRLADMKLVQRAGWPTTSYITPAGRAAIQPHTADSKEGE